MTRTGLLRFVSALCLVLGVSLILVQNDVRAESGQAFSISPPLVELNSEPGKTIETTIKLTNVSSGDLTISAQTNDFGSKNETGEPNIIFEDSKATPYTLKGWVLLPDDFTLASKETRHIPIKINVPANAEPGGHYGVVRFTGASAAGENEVALSASIGSLILLQVAGDITRAAHVEDFYTATTDYAKTSFFESGPVQFVTRLKNEGNIHIKPTGTVEVKDMFGKVVQTTRINGDPDNKDAKPGSILPQSVRRFDTPLENQHLFGKYTASMQLTYGDGKVLDATTTFWVIPYKLILAALVGLAASIALLVWGIRRYNAHIISKAGGQARK